MPAQFTKLTILLIAIAELTVASALDDSLPRRGMLGAQLKPVDDEIRSGHEFEGREGVQISKVIPDSAAANAGLQENDILMAVNGKPIAGQDALADAVAEIGSHKSDEELALRILRRGEGERAITVRLTEMPKETNPEFDTEYGSLEVGGARHRTIVTKPKGDGPFPVVLYLQGLGCGSIDAWFTPHAPLRQLLNALTKAGFATVRAEKRGVGDSEGAPCNELDFKTLLRGHEATLTYAQSLDFVSRVFIFGHSMGGVFAPLIADRQVVDGVIVYGTIGKPLRVYYAETCERQLKLSGADDAEVAQQVETCNALLSLFFDEYLTPGEIAAKAPNFKSFLNERDSDDTHFHGVHYSFWRQIEEIDIARAWSKVNAPVLILYGEADIAASRDDHPYIRDAVNAANPGAATYIELENIGHGFETVDTQKEAMKNYLEGAFNPVVAKTAVKWMQEQP